MRWAAALLLCAGPAGAGCFTAQDMPAKAIYDNGSVLEYLGREGDVLTYRSDKVESRMKAGLWSLESSSQGVLMAVYEWPEALPDLKGVVAAGGKVRLEGKMKASGGKRQTVAIEIEVLGTETVDWEDCRYEAIRFRKTTTVAGGKPVSGVILFAPDAMIVFRSEAADPATGELFSYALKSLE